VLDEIGCKETPRLLLMNKADRIVDPSVRTVLASQYPQAIFVSARRGENAGSVIAAVMARISGPQVSVELEADCSHGKLMQFLQRYAQTDGHAYQGQIVRMNAVITQRRLEELKGFEPWVRILQAQDVA
jgi:GTPase